jgi:uncharacterized protein
MSSARCSEAPSPALLRGIEEFNQQLFFEQHETLEDAWIEETDPVRYVYQGILQIGVGFYHAGRLNFVGATHLLRRGMELLQPFAPSCMSVDVARLLNDTERALNAMVEAGPARIKSFDRGLIPQVHLLIERRDHD